MDARSGPVRDMAQKLVEQLTKGLDFQDGWNLIHDADPAAVKAVRDRRRSVV